jgi:hypothetical protein
LNQRACGPQPTVSLPSRGRRAGAARAGGEAGVGIRGFASRRGPPRRAQGGGGRAVGGARVHRRVADPVDDLALGRGRTFKFTPLRRRNSSDRQREARPQSLDDLLAGEAPRRCDQVKANSGGRMTTTVEARDVDGSRADSPYRTSARPTSRRASKTLRSSRSKAPPSPVTAYTAAAAVLPRLSAAEVTGRRRLMSSLPGDHGQLEPKSHRWVRDLPPREATWAQRLAR